MQITTEISAIFDTTLERAFKSPMLCDITKVHTGYGITPRVTHCTEDENWGKAGGSRKVFMAKSLTPKVAKQRLIKYWSERKMSTGKSKFLISKPGQWALKNFKANGLLRNLKKVKFRSGTDTPCFRTADYGIPFIGSLPN